MESKKKIMAISLEGIRRARAMAMWDGTHLIMTEVRDITGDPQAWLPDMIEDIESKVSNGWVVLVEDRTHSFPAKAIAYNFDTLGPDGRTNLQSALDWYFALDGRGSIILDPSMSKYALRLGREGDIIDAKNDEKGRLVYNVDWQAFNAGHRALLMCVAGAVMEEPLSEHWLRQFVGCIPPIKKPPIWPVLRVMRDLNESRFLRHEASVEAMEARKHVQC